MKHFLLFILAAGPVTVFSQCIENHSGSQNEAPADAEIPLSSHDMRQGEDFHGDLTVKGFSISAGIHSGLFSSPVGKVPEGNREGTVRYTDKQWSQERTGFFVEAIYSPARVKASFGLSANWSSMFRDKQTFTVLPPAASGDVTLYPLHWSMSRKVSVSTLLLFSEIELLHIGRRTKIFARPEAGISYYQSSIEIYGKDTCDCDQFISKAEVPRTSFTAGIGLGARWDYGPVGIRAIAGYRLYNQSGMESRNHFTQSSYTFDAGSYDFSGIPSASLFRPQESPVREYIGGRNGVFFLQLGICVNIGERF